MCWFGVQFNHLIQCTQILIQPKICSNNNLRFLKRLKEMMGDRPVKPALARHLVEYLALALQASLLLQHAPEEIASGFCHGRIGKLRGLAFGAGPGGKAGRKIIDRAFAEE
mgnify:CR=1 FL=1